MEPALCGSRLGSQQLSVCLRCIPGVPVAPQRLCNHYGSGNRAIREEYDDDPSPSVRGTRPKRGPHPDECSDPQRGVNEPDQGTDSMRACAWNEPPRPAKVRQSLCQCHRYCGVLRIADDSTGTNRSNDVSSPVAFVPVGPDPELGEGSLLRREDDQRTGGVDRDEALVPIGVPIDAPPLSRPIATSSGRRSSVRKRLICSSDPTATPWRSRGCGRCGRPLRKIRGSTALAS